MNKFKLLTLLSLVTLTSCQKQDKKHNDSSIRTTKVEIEVVKPSNKYTILKYSGSIEAEKTIPLTFQTTGTVDDIYVNVGDFVKKGDLLAVADKQNMQNAYDVAVAQYEQAVDARNRLKTVYDSNGLPEIKWVEIESKVKQAKAAMNISKKNLENCRLTAPTEGFIGRRELEVGMSVMQIQAPFELVKIGKVYAVISVPEDEINLFRKEQKASITVGALNNAVFIGKVENIGVLANGISRTYTVRIIIENMDNLIKPGMVCEVDITNIQNKQQILIPISSIKKTSSKDAFVFVIDTNTKRALKRYIEIGGIVNNRLTVLSGLYSGDMIITTGIHKISDNTLVRYHD